MRTAIGKALAAAAALALLLTAPASAQVPDPYARQLAQQLAQAEQLLTQEGYSRVAGPFAGGLGQRLTQRYQVTLRAGQDYRILGVCDARCSDVDLRLFDPRNVMLTEDVLADDIPILTVRPYTTGQHTIEVIMHRCTGAPCYFAFNVYAR